MTVEDDNDRLVLLEDFGIDIEVEGRTVTVIFDNGYENELGVWVTVPILTAREIDFENNDKGDSVMIDSVAYTIAESPHIDGQGMCRVVLQKT